MKLRIVGDLSRETVALPASAVRLLVRLLEEMSRGNAVKLIPVHAELTTQEAAGLLQISRPSLIQLLEEGKIKYRRVGTHRRVQFESLVRYKRRADGARRAALAELAAYDQEIGIQCSVHEITGQSSPGLIRNRRSSAFIGGQQ